jgi:hypothetical protein
MFVLWTEHKSKDASLSQLYWNGQWISYICEDEIRQLGFKVPGETAIWGDFIYPLVLDTSGKFGKETPTILGVPFFKFIRMHPGVTDDHTEGCPLFGKNWSPEEMKVWNPEGIEDKIRQIIKNGKPSYIVVVRNTGEGVT